LKRVFVTGGTGLLGANVIEQLLIDGYAVSALCRNAPNDIFPKHPQLQWLQGSLMDHTLLRDTMSGCQFVVHAAAETRQNASKEIYQKTNVTGTKNILVAAQESAVNRVVLVNTANVFRHGTISEPGIESGLPLPPFATLPYTQSKMACLQMARDYRSLDIIHIHPTFMIGRWDFKPSSGRIMKMILNKHLAFYPKGGKNFVSVTDVAQLIIQSFDLGKSGESYLATGENLSYRQFFERVIQANDQKTILLPIPNFLLNILGYMGIFFKKAGIQTELSRDNMKILQISNFYSSKKAQEEFKFIGNGLQSSIHDGIRWFKDR